MVKIYQHVRLHNHCRAAACLNGYRFYNAYMCDNVVPINHHDESPLQLQSCNTVAIF